MKHKYIFIFIINYQILFSTEYDKFLPPYLTGSNLDVTAKTDCKYAEANNPSYRDCYFGFDNGLGTSQNFEYDGGGNGKLNITGKLGDDNSKNKNMDLYFNELKVTNNGNMSISKFHTVLITGSLSISNNSTLSIKMEPKDNTANTQPQYGNDAKLIFTDFLYASSKGNSISNNSTLEVSDGNIMIGKTTFIIDSTSKISVTKNGTNGNNNTGDIYSRGHIKNYGNIKTTTLYNGYADNQGAQGIIPGISSQNTSGRVDNYGTINGDVNNHDGSTFAFHSFNGKMGEVTGTFTNDKGSVIIYIDGANYQKHNLLSNLGGTNGANGNMNPDIKYSNGSEEFINATMSSDKKSLEVTLKQDAVNNFKKDFKGTRKGILNALNSRYNIYSQGGSKFVSKTVDNATKGIWSNYITAPLALIDAIKPSLDTNTSNVMVGVIGAGFFGDYIGRGGLGGINISSSLLLANNILKAQIGYGYGSISNNSGISESYVNTNLIMLSLMDQININNIEIYAGLHSSIGFFNTMQYFAFNNFSYEKRANAKFNLYGINLDSNVGYRFKFGNYQVKPYIGLNQEIYIQSSFNENGGLEINSNGYTNYIPYIVLGIENRYKLANKNELFAKVNYERMFLETLNQTKFYSNKEEVLLASPYNNRIGLELGGDIVINNSMFITLSGFYKTNIDAIHYLGGNASFRYLF